MSHTPTQSHSRVIAFHHSRFLPLAFLGVLVGLAVLSLIAYGYYLNRAVEFAAMRVAEEEERSRLSSAVAALEAERAALEDTLTLARAEDLGLVESAHPVFLSRSDTRELSLARGTEGL